MTSPVKSTGALPIKFKFKSDARKDRKKKQQHLKRKSSDAAFSRDEPPGYAVDKVSTNPDNMIADDGNDSEDEFLTPAQLAQKRKSQEKEIEEARARADVSYRQRLAAFNKRLASTTEHNDIPRVSAAGNG